MEHVSRRTFLKSSAAPLATTALSGFSPASVSEQSVQPRYVVAFEVQTTAETQAAYLKTAKELRPLLDQVQGFQSIERSASLTQSYALLSLSYWADEAALVAWRATEEHHVAQEQGRTSIFADYRLRVGPVMQADGGHGTEPSATTTYNCPPFHSRQFMAIARLDGITNVSEIDRCLASLTAVSNDRKAYRSFLDSKRYFVTCDLPVMDGVAKAVSRTLYEANQSFKHLGASLAIEIVEVERDYGLKARAQAPQYFPEVHSNGEGG
jgi:heme-degrading monooxygenase HmoA